MAPSPVPHRKSEGLEGESFLRLQGGLGRGLEFVQLTGFEEPQLFSEIPTTQRMGGGPDPVMGNFWTNNQNLKILSVMGGSAIEGRSWVGSDGTGTSA